ncbi:MAG: recombinase family protein [Gracilibacteraceae bacterium]|jgi:DNA invertase Pin-like site-specific DNA recombinase|nr:recombinase family protein [Gracilibacteraceae bacterium]
MARKSRKNRQPEATAVKAAVYAATGYTRVSADGEKSEDSMENQAAIIRDYVRDKTDLDLKNVITTDTGYTGMDFDRPGYAELMTGILDGSTKCVIVKDLSRLGRTYIEVGELLFDTFPACNVRFISINDYYDSFADDAGRKKLLILFKNLVNHVYSRDLGKKIRSAHDAKKRRGEPIGGKPYGYRKSEDGKTLIIEPEEAAIVRRVFDMRLDGESVQAIAKLLNRERVPSPQKRRFLLGEIFHEKFAGDLRWSAYMLSNLLRNETYTGRLLQNKYDCDGKKHRRLPSEQWIRHENAHSAIISQEQFGTVQTLLDGTAEKYRPKKRCLPENRYVGRIFCSRCGHPARRISGGSDNSIFYYICRRCADELKYERGIKRASSLTLARLDAVVTKTLRAQMDLIIEYDSLVTLAANSDAIKQKRAELSRDRARQEKTSAAADATIKAAYTHHLGGLLDFREYELVREKARRAKEEAEARLACIEGELRRLDVHGAKHNTWREQFGAFHDFDAPTKELIQALVSRITVTPMTNEIGIELNYMDSFAELRVLIEESGVGADA